MTILKYTLEEDSFNYNKPMKYRSNDLIGTPTVKETLGMTDQTYLTGSQCKKGLGILGGEFFSERFYFDRPNLLRHWIVNGVSLFFLMARTNVEGSAPSLFRYPFLTLGECYAVLDDIKKCGYSIVEATVFPIEELNKPHTDEFCNKFTNWDYYLGSTYSNGAKMIYSNLTDEHLNAFLPSETIPLLSKSPFDSPLN